MKERGCKQKRAERERETQNLKQAVRTAVGTEPNAGLKLTNCEIMTRAEVRHLTN